MQASGSFLEDDIRDILLRMASRHAIGTMIAQSAGEVLTVSFDQGEIIGADLNEPFVEGLGRLLVDEGALKSEHLMEVAELGLRAPADILEYLISRDRIAEFDLKRGQRAYVFSLLTRLLGWSTGEFKFYRAEASEEPAPFKPVSVEELLVRSSEEGSGEYLGVIPLLDDRVFKKVATSPAGEADGELEGPLPGGQFLTRFEERVLKLVDGESPTSSYERSLGADEYRIRYAIHRLLREGMIEPGEAPASSEEAFDLGEVEVPQFELEPRPVEIEPLLDSPARDEPTDRSLEPASLESEVTTEVPVTAESTGGPMPRPAMGLNELRQLFQSVSVGWSYFLAAVLATLLGVPVLVEGEARLPLYALPWQSQGISQMEERQRQTAYVRIERAVKTGHLLNGEPPRELTQLVDTGLLSRDDLYDSAGRWFVYGTTEEGFTLEAAESGAEGAPGFQTFSLRDDFLLDPAFGREALDDSQPIILLD